MSEVNWICRHCDKMTEDGWVWLRGAEMNKAVEAMTIYDKREHDSYGKFNVVTIEEILSLPDGGKWSVICNKCYRDDMERMNDYDIGIERISTIKDVLDWTFHLSKKNWFEYTDWEDFVRKAIPEKMDA